MAGRVRPRHAQVGRDGDDRAHLPAHGQDLLLRCLQVPARAELGDRRRAADPHPGHGADGLPAAVRPALLLGDRRRQQHHRLRSGRRPVPRGLPARRPRGWCDHDPALLRHPHAARARADRRADRGPPVPGGEAGHDGPALAEGSAAEDRGQEDRGRLDGAPPDAQRRRCSLRQKDKEDYLVEYEVLKKKGKPFFPYAVMKDSAMALVVVLVIVFMSLMLGAEQGPKVDPTTTTYVPRPEWYFFFLFELLRVIKPPWATPIATIGIPTIAMVLLLLLPFYDRNPERRPQRRPIALTAGILTIIAIAYLTYLGATAGSPTEIDLEVAAEFEPGKEVVAQEGCLACHKLGENGNNGPGPELTQIGENLPRNAIARSLEVGPGIMPSYAGLPPQKQEALTAFLASLN